MRDEVALIERTGARLSENGWPSSVSAATRRWTAIWSRSGRADAVRARLSDGILDGRIAVASGADRRKVEFQLAKVGIADTARVQRS